MESKINIRNIFEAFIIILIIVDIVLVMWITFVPVNASLTNTIIRFDLIVCIIIFFDFIYRMNQKDDKKAFIIKNWPDIIAMIPLLTFGVNIPYIRLFRLFRLLALFRRDYKYITGFFKQTHINIAIGMLLFTLFAGTIVFYIVEHGTDPSVHTLWDSMWFTVTIMLTGNSTFNPDTQIGKVISVIIIIVGISFVGILTASLASWLINKSNKIQNDKEEKRLKNIETSMDDMKNDIRELKELLKDKL